MRESITEGVFPEAVDAQIFDAPEGEVVGPIETDAGTYVFQVDSVTEATTHPVRRGARPDRRAARRPGPAGGLQRLPQRLSRPLGGADRLRRRLRDRALRQLRGRDPALPRPEPARGAAAAAARADRLPAARALHQPRCPRIASSPSRPPAGSRSGPTRPVRTRPPGRPPRRRPGRPSPARCRSSQAPRRRRAPPRRPRAPPLPARRLAGPRWTRRPGVPGAP